MTFPRQQPGQSHDDHQREMAEWVGYSVREMNDNHDATHDLLCRFLEVKSHSLMAARGEEYDRESAELEEAAVLHVQRFMAHHGRAWL